MIRELIALNDNSRVWVYQANRELTQDEVDLIRPLIFKFVDQWSSHGANVGAYGNIFHKRFIVLFADDANLVSGCSIDSSVRFVREVGNLLQVDFFNRELFAFIDGENIFTIPRNELAQAYANQKVRDNSLVFDNLIGSKSDFINKWIKPLNESWHHRFI